MASKEQQPDEELNCPMCMGPFNDPRELPCAHTYCHGCLQLYITTKAAEVKNFTHILCPVCQQAVKPKDDSKLPNEWASTFPANVILQMTGRMKLKVERVCDACSSEGVVAQAEVVCANCQEAMCADCAQFHKKLKISRHHSVVRVEDLGENIDNVLKCSEELGCTIHYGEEEMFYCRNHQMAVCAHCFFDCHKNCADVVDVRSKKGVSSPENIITGEIAAELLKQTEYLTNYMTEIGYSQLNLDCQVSKLVRRIQDQRTRLNEILDNLENKVKIEKKRVEKLEDLRRQDEKRQCLLLINAMKMSKFLLKTVDKHGTDLQKFLMAEKIKTHLQLYYKRMRESFKIVHATEIEMKFNSVFELLLNESDVGSLLTVTKAKELCCPASFMLPLLLSSESQNKKITVVKVVTPTEMEPFYTGAAYLARGEVMLADWINKQCILLSSSYQYLSSYTMTDWPCNLCEIDDREIAVTVPKQQKIHVLSICTNNNSLTKILSIDTEYPCYGITRGGAGKMIVTQDIGYNRGRVCIFYTGENVLPSVVYEAPAVSWSSMAFDVSRGRLYNSDIMNNSILCLDLGGRTLFHYSSPSLALPCGVTLDRDGNVYVTGQSSNNIHQFSQTGNHAKVINLDSLRPRAICFHQQLDMFLVTSDSQTDRLLLYSPA